MEIRGRATNQKLIANETKEGGYPLKFGRVHSPETKFHQVDTELVLIRQKSSKRKLVLAQYQNELKIYEIKNKKIQFVSEHKIDFPPDIAIKRRIVTETRIRYFVKIQLIDLNDPQQVESFQEPGIDLRDLSYSETLVFECRFDLEQCGVIRPVFLGKLGDGKWNRFTETVMTIFEGNGGNWLNNRDLWLVKEFKSPYLGKNQIGEGDYIYLASLWKNGGILLKRLIRLNLRFWKMSSYRRKLEKDQEMIAPEFRLNLTFSSKPKRSEFFLGDTEPGMSRQLKSFIRVDQKMIIVGWIDFRLKKIRAKRFISIYEMFSDFDFQKILSLNPVNLQKIDYFEDLDLLLIDVWLVKTLSTPPQGQTWSLLNLESDIDLRFRDREQLKASWIDEGTQRTVSSSFHRVKIWGLFLGKKRKIEIEEMSLFTNSSFSKSGGMLITFKENLPGMKVNLIKKAIKTHYIGNRGVKRNAKEMAQKCTKKVLNVDSSAEQSSLSFLMDEESKKRGIWACDIQSALIVEKDLVLVVTSRMMLLFDTISKDLISSFQYNEAVPSIPEEIHIQDNLLITCNRTIDCLEVFKICPKHQKGIKFFKTVGFIDMKRYYRFYSLRHILGFRMLKPGVYEVKAAVNWITESRYNPHNLIVLSIRFQTSKNLESSMGRYLAILSESIDCVFPMHSNLLKNYSKASESNYLFQNSEFLFGVQIHSATKKPKRRHFKYPIHAPEMSQKSISHAHIHRNNMYVFLTSKIFNEMTKINFKQQGASDEMGQPMIVKSKIFNYKDSIRFDEVTEKFRIFVLSKRWQTLDVLNEDLQVTWSLDTSFLKGVTKLVVLAENKILVSGFEERTRDVAEDDIADNSQGTRIMVCSNRPRDGAVEVNMIIDLETLKRRDLVSMGGRSFYGYPFTLYDDRFLVFNINEKGRGYFRIAERKGVFVSLD